MKQAVGPICLRCKELVDRTTIIAGVPDNFHLDCYIAYLSRLLDTHGPRCFTCGSYEPKAAEGGKGLCRAGRKEPRAGRVGCARWTDKVAKLRKLRDRGPHRWDGILQAQAKQATKKRKTRRKAR